MHENNDIDNSRKILELYDKLKNNEFIISFAGHFSAGKSSMINALLDMDILPKSPIPTSANIVKVTSGGGYARMYFHEEEPVQYNEPYDMELIRSFCKDKQSIHTIEINTSEQILPPHTAIFDTPGIDAADDADRLMTEGSLHNADVLFYVMDYNHVQSEVNLSFLQQLKEKEVPYYVIINQIDKHNEQEIPFETFNAQIKHTFSQWHIEPLHIFYTSLKDPEASHNMFPAVKKTIQDLVTTDRDIHPSIKRSMQDLVEQHKQFLTNEYEDQVLSLDSSEENEEEAYLFHQLKRDRNTCVEQMNIFYDELFKEMNQTLTNAQIMPFDMREHARLYLESLEPTFKVGLFGSKKKTTDEKERRKHVFAEELISVVESAIQWNLRDKIKALAKAYDIPHTLVDAHLNDIAIGSTEKIIESSVRKGAQISGEYVLNYTKDVHSEINTLFRKMVRSLWGKIKVHFTDHIQDIDNQLASNEQSFTKAIATEEEINHMREMYDKRLSTLENVVKEPTYDAHTEAVMKQAIEDLFHSYTLLDASEVISLNQADVPFQAPNDETTEREQEKQSYSIEETIDEIDQAVKSLEELSGFDSYVNDLLDKKRRLEHRSLTVALFGAFSAGKSSFANALLGSAVLPSSPNPTTAVITKISPINKIHTHGDVVISIKNEEEIVRDIQAMTKDHQPPEGSLSTLLTWVKEKDIIHKESIDQMYRAYIHAMVDGYAYMKDKIGSKETIDLERFATYATEETKACYIQEIDVHYDCSITQKGITLVDTPGADSVNARHTNVSFEYIKEADAILYVTYYNHALSRADKDFLMQLGRVKESFELDKMFFIINAADLASDEKELQLVHDYVAEQLMLLGIRFPSVYPISSKQVLENGENEHNKRKFNTFLSDFFTFLNKELPALTMESAYVDMRRTLQALDGHIDYVQLDGAEKEARGEQLRTFEQRMYHMLNNRSTETYEAQILQRIERQLYYVIERLGIRFHDFFKETFNPTTITESGRKGQEQMYAAANALLRYSGYEFLQEIRAIALRVEAEMRTQLFAHYEEAKNSLQAIDDSFILPMIEDQRIETPDFDEPFESLTYKTFQSSVKYNGMKAFFVQNEKDMIRDKIYAALQPYIDSYVDQVKEIMSINYMKQWSVLTKDNDATYKNQVKTFMSHQQKMLQEVVDVDVLIAKRDEIKAIVQ